MDSVLPLLTVLVTAVCLISVIPSDTSDSDTPYGEYCGQTSYGDTYVMHLNDRDVYVAYQQTENGLVAKIIA